jgi:DNA-binding response OmpR family regulator
MNAAVLLVDDDRAFRKLIRAYLQEEGVGVLECGSGEEAVELAREHRPALVLLDVRLPGIDGFEVLRRFEAAGLELPVIMLTSLSDEIDQLVGFRLGAVDYVTKPVSPKILAAKVRAFLTRVAGHEASHRRTEIGSLVVEHDAHRVLVAGREVALTRREFDLLAALAEHPGWVYDRDHLMLGVWGYSSADVETRVVDQHVANLRRKLEVAGARGLVQTVRGVGYRLVAPAVDLDTA